MNNFPNDKYAVIVDGQALNVIFHHRQLTMEFQSICLDSAAVLCCRMSPSQKASVIHFIQIDDQIKYLNLHQGCEADKK